MKMLHPNLWRADYCERFQAKSKPIWFSVYWFRPLQRSVLLYPYCVQTTVLYLQRWLQSRSQTSKPPPATQRALLVIQYISSICDMSRHETETPPSVTFSPESESPASVLHTSVSLIRISHLFQITQHVSTQQPAIHSHRGVSPRR